MLPAPTNSKTWRTPSSQANVLRVDHHQQVRRRESAPAANGATADAAAGPSAAKTKTIAVTSMTTDQMLVVANNDDAPKATGATLSSSGNVTAPPAKSSAARTDPSPSASSEEEWHSTSSRLQRTPHSGRGSASSASSSFYATPGTTGTDRTTIEAIKQANNGGRNNFSGDLSSSTATSSSDKIADARKKLQWTPPPGADNKVRLRICRELRGRSIIQLIGQMRCITYLENHDCRMWPRFTSCGYAIYFLIRNGPRDACCLFVHLYSFVHTSK